jgi:hypothetical protein
MKQTDKGISQDENLKLWFSVIEKATGLPVGCEKRMKLVHNAIQGILRAKVKNYNPVHA